MVPAVKVAGTADQASVADVAPATKLAQARSAVLSNVLFLLRSIHPHVIPALLAPLMATVVE
ncbi:hypothetical protein D3C73_1584900 [compost metagenome]